RDERENLPGARLSNEIRHEAPDRIVLRIDRPGRSRADPTPADSADVSDHGRDLRSARRSTVRRLAKGSRPGFDVAGDFGSTFDGGWINLMDRSDVAIIGAGPYGLAAAAHLRQIAGLDIRLFGEPMSFWERHMPRGMRLRSPWLGSHIADPEQRFTLDAYRDAVGPAGLAYPVPATDFVKYGRWFQ